MPRTLVPEMPHHAWDDPPPASGSSGDDDDDGWGHADPDNEEDTRPASEKAADEFLEVLLGLYNRSDISAESVCTMCHWAHLAGMPLVGRFAVSPGSTSGHYSRRLKAELGFDALRGQMYSFDIPAMGKHQLTRGTHLLQTIPPRGVARASLFGLVAQATIAGGDCREQGPSEL